VTAVETIPRTKIYTKHELQPTWTARDQLTDRLALPIKGLISCPTAPPIGFAVSIVSGLHELA